MPRFLWNNFAFAPSGSAADAGPDEDVDDKPGDEIPEGDKEGGEADGDTGPPETEGGDPEPDAEPETETVAERMAAEDYFKAAGLGYINDPQQFTREIRQLQERASKAQQLEQWYLQNQQQQAQQPKPPEPVKVAESKKLWEVPQFAPALKDGLMLAEDGVTIVAKPGYPPDLPQKYREYQMAVENAQRQSLEMLSDPRAMFEQHFQPLVMPLIQQAAAQIAQQSIHQSTALNQEAQFLRTYEAENPGLVYDELGNVTPFAQQFNQHLETFKQHGIPNAHELVAKLMDGELFRAQASIQGQQAAPPAKPPTKAEQQLGYLKARAGRAPQKTGSLPDKTKSKPDQNPKDPWGQGRRELLQLPPEAFALN